MSHRLAALCLVVACGYLGLPQLSEGAYTLNFYVNNDRVANASVVKISHGSAPSVTLVCQSTKADQTLLRSHPTLFEYMQDGSNQTLANEGQDPTHLTHTVDDDSNWHIYLCGYPNIPLIKVTIDFGDATPPPQLTDTTTPTAPTSPTSPTGATGSGDNNKFTGLNPLIYTISAVVLLGTLAIISIITCWVRARRSFQARMMQTSTAAQDYLDYISDNEFTPMTSSEFMASLQERPPTYLQSEEMISQQRPSGEESRGEEEEEEEGSARAEGRDAVSQTPNELQTPPRSRREVDRQRAAAGSSLLRRERPRPNSSTVMTRAEIAGANSEDQSVTREQRDGDGRSRDEALRNIAEPPIALLVSVDDGPEVGVANLTEVGMAPQTLGLETPTQEEINTIEATVGVVNRRINRARVCDRGESGGVERRRGGGVEGGMSEEGRGGGGEQERRGNDARESSTATSDEPMISF